MAASFSWGSDKDRSERTIDANSSELWMPESATDADIALLAQICPQLWKLSLYGCAQISDAGLAHIAELKQLLTLNLMGCQKITDSGLLGLASLQIFVNTHETAITEAGYEAFRAAQEKAQGK